MAASLAGRTAAPAAARRLAAVGGGGRAGGAGGRSWPRCRRCSCRARTRALTDQDTIVLADFMNTTGEPVFDGALKVALAVALEQSPFLRVFPDDRVRETLRLMQRPPDERVTRAIAREIAQREQLKALVAGSIGIARQPLRRSRSRRSTPRPATSWRASRSRSPAKEQVLTSLGTATPRLREKLGESLASIQKFDVPLPRATTPSLEALHAYSLALDQGRVIPRRRGDSAPEAGASSSTRTSRWRRRCCRASTPTPGSRAEAPALLAPGVRAARPGQRARAVLHFVALLPRRRPGVGQGARAGPVVDHDLSARSVRVQQPGHRLRRVRPARAGGRTRSAKRSVSIPGSCRRTATSSGR